uniref:Small ribosomal subunit protein uS9c n=1 Tax=Pedinomonas tuberculata TaxID=160064 RepID=A0A097KLB7_9CHLO|nr:ribosomal protein S9 [Pedinomonas tuberculata]AIT93958.1 ribosomal protein S9 [Pedinomonas tuberculata]
MKTTGRRKTAIAQATFQAGSGNFTINGKTLQDYLGGRSDLLLIVQSPLKVLELQTNYDTVISVEGGGLTGQAEAIRLALARGLCNLDATYRPLLKLQGFLTRDAREKERRKYGLKKARKAPQFSKR